MYDVYIPQIRAVPISLFADYADSINLKNYRNASVLLLAHAAIKIDLFQHFRSEAEVIRWTMGSQYMVLLNHL